MKAYCTACGKEFDRPPAHLARATKALFCSHACHGEWQKGANNHAYAGGRVPCVCVQCGKEFSVKPCEYRRGVGKYCSRPCQTQGYRDRPHAKKPDCFITCGYCGVSFKIIPALLDKKKYCSKLCANRAHRAKMKGPGNGRYLHGRSEERYSADFRALAPDIRTREGLRCFLCHVTQAANGKDLDVHHIDYDKDNNEPLNLVALCPTCHGAMHGSAPSRKRWRERLSSELRASQPPSGFITSG